MFSDTYLCVRTGTWANPVARPDGRSETVFARAGRSESRLAGRGSWFEKPMALGSRIGAVFVLANPIILGLLVLGGVTEAALGPSRLV